MATRTGRLSKPDAQGEFARQLGWKLNSAGKRVQHKFRLGTDRRKAEARDVMLRKLWAILEIEDPANATLWDDETLAIAKQVAKGFDRVLVPPLDDQEQPNGYCRRLQAIQDRFRFIRFEPEDKQRYKQGLSDEEFACNGIVLDGLSEQIQRRRNDERPEALHHPLQPSIDIGTVLQDHRGHSFGHSANGVNNVIEQKDEKTLHQAFDAYTAWVREEYFRPELDGLSDYGHTKLGQLKSLKARHDDIPLHKVDFSHLEKMYRFWRRRPPTRTTARAGQPMSIASIRHYLGELDRFFRWVHRSSDFAWRKPDGFEDLDKHVQPNTSEIKSNIRQVRLFTLDELRILNSYATPMDRLFLMLALNCGFGAKEIATLTIGECHLDQALPQAEQELFHFPSTSSDSFVTLVRNKTTIVGKYLLFRQTAELVRWTMRRRMLQSTPSPDQPLILNGKGQPLDMTSKSGHPSRQISNAFARLKKRAASNGESVNDLPFKCLRKTAGDMIRRFSNGEVSGIFLLHGTPVPQDKLSDVYTNRPFGKVYQAIREVEAFLEPVFAVSSSPTEEQTLADTKRSVMDTIAELHRGGASVREIEAQVSLSRSTIQRHIKKLEQ